MEFRILGPLQGTVGGRPLRLSGRQSRLVLASLLLAPGRVVPVERLIEAVWGVASPVSARTQIAIAVSNVRRAIGDTAGSVIETVAPGYRLRGDASWIDTRTVEERVAEGRAAAAVGRLDEAVLFYRGALLQWRGPVLHGLDRSNLAPAVLPWEELRLSLHEEAAEIDLARGRHRTLAGALMPVVAEEPYRERLRYLLMMALVRSGRLNEALAVYREGRRLLAGELGLEPGPGLRGLNESILRNARDARDAQDAGDARSTRSTRNARMARGPARSARHACC
ncbi:AfsR/SARP family transcriptional regulator [Actinomadura barringtoniae]|uniref:AfsR/SARP family transcriptional regulator n=1 Tax=Actinomadura barringtoniae TaxID=1427535 RepID=A0A939PFC5_9ACTN|nr:AfsR/SARP family transcriptional regulator [Actinomadura barringtoniae]MBO2451601.1 AfsR/SARP family transcriptional regulator [Actinomadura barringtoniae]